MSVCVRFSTAAAGRLRVADARAALFGWLLARHEGGMFHVHIQDDGRQERMTEDGQAICKELRWLGLDWDEGLEPGSPSERSALYQRYARDGTPAGRPSPLLARVVDDHKMAITHVIRDARWLPDTEQELALYRALGWDAPRYVHLPPIRGLEHASVGAYRERGILALALANQLARLGWSPRGKRELLSMEDMAARFDLERVSRAPVRFDLEQLHVFNRRCLRALGEDEVTALLVPHWRKAYGAADRAAGTALAPQQWRRTLALAIRGELDCLDQAAEQARFAFVDEVVWEGEARQALAQPYAVEVLEAFVLGLPGVEPFGYDAIDAYIRDLRLRFKAAWGIRSRDVMYVIRAALTGQRDGPCLIEACQLLGRDRCLARAQAAISTLCPHLPAPHTTPPPGRQTP